MHARLPVVRHFIACEEVEEIGGQFSLKRLIHRIRPQPGVEFPRIHPALSFFVLLSEGEGLHEFHVEVVYWSAGQEVVLWRTKIFQHVLGSDPVAVHGWPIRLQNLYFREPGQYDFVLICDGQEAARETIYAGDV